MSDTYSSVDRSLDVDAAVAWQDRIARWPAVAAYKARARELIGAGRPVLDVGCGTGVDLAALGGRGFGIDRSFAMCRAARRRPEAAPQPHPHPHPHLNPRPVAMAEASHLPFGAGWFAGVRADRVLQHLVDPGAAIREMVRVTRPGGTVVAAEPDQGSLVVSVPGAPVDLVERVVSLRREVGIRNGRLARHLPALWEEAGLIEITVDAFALVLTDPDDAFGLPGWVTYWREQGPFDDADERVWTAAMTHARDHAGFVYAVTYLVVSGTRVGERPAEPASGSA